MARRLLQVCFVSAVALAGCRVVTDYAGTRYRCSDGVCPKGYVCVAAYCEPVADAMGAPDTRVPDAAQVADSAPRIDAADVCALAAEQPDNDDCNTTIEVFDETTTYGDTTGYSNDHTPAVSDSCTARTTDGPDAVYEVAANVGETITATMTPEGWDGALYIVQPCSTYVCLAGSDEPTPGWSEAVQLVTELAGPFYVIVDGATAADSGCFTLVVHVN